MPGKQQASDILYTGVRENERRHNEIKKQRRKRNVLVLLLLLALAGTLVYGTLENPFRYTFSKIGNYFPYREW